MALLHAMGRVARRSVAMVATFDHGTGPAASRATQLVAREAGNLGLPAVMGHASVRGNSEAEWREARREFLFDVAARLSASVATAHTRDDQLETVVMRVLRRAGARGLAGLYAPTDSVRPLLECSRAEVAAYAKEVGASWVEDPANASMRFLRNRVRRDLLPALTQASPGLDDALLAVAKGAASWRVRLDALARDISRVATGSDDAGRMNGGEGGSAVVVKIADLRPYTTEELAVLWPAIAGQIGLAMDWRGTQRAAAFTNASRPGSRIQLSGGWEIVRRRDCFELRRWRTGDGFNEARGRRRPLQGSGGRR